MQAGIPCISPVTTKFRNKDIERLVRLTKRAGQVIICNDSEESGAGEEGALITAATLHAVGRDVRIATLPRPEGKEKIDVNELVATQGPKALERVLDDAKRYLEYLLCRIPEDTPKDKLKASLKPVFDLVAEAEPLDQQIYVDAIADRFGLGRQALKQQIKEVARQNSRKAAENRHSSGLPLIRVNDRQLSEIAREAGKILVISNKERMEHAAKGDKRPGGVPVVFVRADGLVRLVHRDNDVSVSVVDRDTGHAIITRIADWVHMNKKEISPVFPPRDVSRDLLTLAPEGLPALDSVISTPVFGSDGDLVSTPGYHEKDRLWLHPGNGLDLPEVPKHPTRAQVDEARCLFTEELFADFPFADRVGSMAALLFPFVRRMITGTTPIHLFEAPTPGSGKSLLCNLISIVTTGSSAEARTLPEQEEEVRKMITAELSRARPMILIDNASERKKLDSAALASVTTTPDWTDRLLGKSKMLSLSNQALWMLTANNPRISNEITRRCIRIRIDPKQDRPWQRQGFKHDPITVWAQKERTRLVHAALSLVQAWIVEGTPAGSEHLGSFESWVQVIGGLLRVAGVDGFLAKQNDFYAAANSEGEAWRDFVAVWWAAFGNEGKRIAELNDLCEQEGLMNTVRGDKSSKSQQIRLEYALKSSRDRVYGNCRIELSRDRGAHKGRLYQLVSIDDTRSEGDRHRGQQDLWDERDVPEMDEPASERFEY